MSDFFAFDTRPMLIPHFFDSVRTDSHDTPTRHKWHHNRNS